MDRQQRETTFILVSSQERIKLAVEGRGVLQVRWRSYVREVEEKVQVEVKNTHMYLLCAPSLYFLH